MVLILQYVIISHLNGIFSLIITSTAFIWFNPTLYGCNNSPICFYFALKRFPLHKNPRKPRHTNYIYMVLPYMR